MACCRMDWNKNVACVSPSSFLYICIDIVRFLDIWFGKLCLSYFNFEIFFPYVRIWPVVGWF